MRYENPLYMAEDAGAADLISGGRLQLGISRGSPEQVIDGYRYFGHVPADGMSDADMAREHTRVFLEVLKGEGFAQPNPRPMFPNPPGLLRLEPHSPGLRDRIWWGAGTRATAEWTGEQGMNLMSSTLLTEDTGVPFHQLQAEQIQRFRDAWKAAGHDREPRVSVSRSIFPIVNDLDRQLFWRERSSTDQVGFLDGGNARFGRTYAGEPDKLVAELAEDEAIAAADTLLLTVPNQLGVDYNAHVIESVLTHLAPGAGLALERNLSGVSSRSNPAGVPLARSLIHSQLASAGSCPASPLPDTLNRGRLTVLLLCASVVVRNLDLQNKGQRPVSSRC